MRRFKILSSVICIFIFLTSCQVKDTQEDVSLVKVATFLDSLDYQVKVLPIKRKNQYFILLDSCRSFYVNKIDVNKKICLYKRFQCGGPVSREDAKMVNHLLAKMAKENIISYRIDDSVKVAYTAIDYEGISTLKNTKLVLIKPIGNGKITTAKFKKLLLDTSMIIVQDRMKHWIVGASTKYGEFESTHEVFGKFSSELNELFYADSCFYIE